MYVHKKSHEYPYTPKGKIKRLSVSSIPGPLSLEGIRMLCALWKMDTQLPNQLAILLLGSDWERWRCASSQKLKCKYSRKREQLKAGHAPTLHSQECAQAAGDGFLQQNTHAHWGITTVARRCSKSCWEHSTKRADSARFMHMRFYNRHKMIRGNKSLICCWDRQ